MIKVFEMFSGYGGASWGLRKANIPFECIGISEVDKYAIECFNNNFPNTKNFGDCSKIDPKDLPDFDLLTGGFPCQDVSITGKRDLSKGRTNLYQEILRIAKAKMPKYILLENVKGLTSMKVNERSLHLKIASDLTQLGYGVCWKILNSKDYGIPHNRERIWFVCKWGGWDFMEFQFPNPIKLKLFLKDIVEKDVDDKYFLSEKLINGIKRRMKEKKIRINPKVANCITGRYEAGRGNETYVKPIITHSLQERSLNRPSFQKAIKEGKTLPGGFGQLSKGDGTSYCLDTGNTQCIEVEENFRRLTPRECFRLMGFLNDEINLDNVSNNQLYKLAGNGWDVNLVSKIFKIMIKSEKRRRTSSRRIWR